MWNAHEYWVYYMYIHVYDYDIHNTHIQKIGYKKIGCQNGVGLASSLRAATTNNVTTPDSIFPLTCQVGNTYSCMVWGHVYKYSTVYCMLYAGTHTHTRGITPAHP